MNLKLKFSHEFTNNPYLHSAVSKALNNFKIRRAQEARNNQFFFQFFQNNELFEIFKMFKKAVELTFTIQKANVCSPWTACSVLNWKFFFWINLVQKLKVISLSWNFVPRLIQICKVQWSCSLFLFPTGSTFLGKFGPKNQNCQFELKFCTTLTWISRIM